VADFTGFEDFEDGGLQAADDSTKRLSSIGKAPIRHSKQGIFRDFVSSAYY
jgi:hypothetical protein